MESEDEVMDACAAIIVAAGVDERRRERSVWSENWLTKRDTHGSYASLYNDLKIKHNLFLRYLRIPESTCYMKNHHLFIHFLFQMSS